MHGTPLARAAIGVVLLFTGAACGESPTQAVRNGPSISLSINLAHENGVLDTAGAMGAATVVDLLLPYDVRYRKVDALRMTRRGDGAEFDWTETVPGRRSALSDVFGSPPNWVLPLRGSNGRLGLRDLVPGDTLDITVETGKRSVVTTLVLPGVPELSLTQENGSDVVRWRRVRGAAYYELLAPTESYEPIYTSDSSLVLRRPISLNNPSIVVAQVYDAATARRRLMSFGLPEQQDGVRIHFMAWVSDRIAVPN